jgi:hypothetical protein
MMMMSGSLICRDSGGGTKVQSLPPELVDLMPELSKFVNSVMQAFNLGELGMNRCNTLQMCYLASCFCQKR